MCECPAPYSGPRCEHATEIGELDRPQQAMDEEEDVWLPECSAGECTVPDFTQHSFLELPSLENVAKYSDIEVWFLTRALDGLLLYNGGKPLGAGDFICLNLVQVSGNRVGDGVFINSVCTPPSLS